MNFLLNRQATTRYIIFPLQKIRTSKRYNNCNIIFNYQFTKRSDISSAVAVNRVHGARAHIVRSRRVITYCAITSKYNRIVTYDSVTSALGISYNTRRQRRSLWRCYRLSLFTRQSHHDPWNGPARLRLIPGFLDTMTIVRCSLFRSRTDRPRARALIPSDYPLIRTRNWNAPAAILFIMSPSTCVTRSRSLNSECVLLYAIGLAWNFLPNGLMGQRREWERERKSWSYRYWKISWIEKFEIGIIFFHRKFEKIEL